MLRLYCSLAIGAMLFATLGCGGGPGGEAPVPVTGKVLYKGKPVEGALVTFHSKSEGRPANGRTDANGAFALMTYKTADGAIPGDYIVTVTKPKESESDDMDVGEDEYGEDYGKMMDAAGEAGDGGATAAEETTLPAKYADVQKTPLALTVTKDPPNEFEIVLED